MILKAITIPVSKYSTKIMLFADSAMTIVNVDNKSTSVNSFQLEQNYPNPFNPATLIKYSLPGNGLVTLKVYDLLGKEVTILENGYRNSGTYSVIFNGSSLTSGIYFYRLEFKGNSVSKKMILIK